MIFYFNLECLKNDFSPSVIITASILRQKQANLENQPMLQVNFFNVKKLFMHNWHNILFKFGLFEKITLYQQLLSKLASKIDTGKED